MSGRLTAIAVKALCHDGRKDRPIRVPDGDGLYLQVTRSNTKSWLFRYKVAGREREMGLGAYGDPPDKVTLAEARKRASAARALLAEGQDPLDVRKAERARASDAVQLALGTSFEAVALEMLSAKQDEWGNAKHRQQWYNTLSTYAYPHIGHRPVAEIGVAELETVLRPIWQTKPETAGRLRARILKVLRFARAHGLRPPEAQPVSEISEALFERLPKLAAMKRAAKYGHYPALDWREAPAFMADLSARTSMSAAALRFLILTAARTGEVLGMQWSEVDLDDRIWTVPASRMKARKEHRVPLLDAAMAELRCVEPLSEGPDSFVFPGARAGRPLSEMSLTMLLRGMCDDRRSGQASPRWVDKRSKRAITVHGMRSTFRDWAADATDYPREVVEAALAHQLEDDVEAAYQRSDLLGKRTPLMHDWKKYLGL